MISLLRHAVGAHWRVEALDNESDSDISEENDTTSVQVEEDDDDASSMSTHTSPYHFPSSGMFSLLKNQSIHRSRKEELVSSADEHSCTTQRRIPTVQVVLSLRYIYCDPSIVTGVCVHVLNGDGEIMATEKSLTPLKSLYSQLSEDLTFRLYVEGNPTAECWRVEIVLWEPQQSSQDYMRVLSVPFSDIPLQFPPGDVNRHEFPAPAKVALGKDLFEPEQTRKAAHVSFGLTRQDLDPETGQLMNKSQFQTSMDRNALVKLLDVTSKPSHPWNICTWADGRGDMSQWNGVKLSSTERVIKLDLCGNSLQGELPRTWLTRNPGLGCSLDQLVMLDLSNNSLKCESMPDFSSFLSLQMLDLSENTFHGRLTDLKLPRSVEIVNLSYNRFTGPLTASFLEQMPAVRVLRLSGCKLKCELPSGGWRELHKLRHLSLCQSLLHGIVPMEIAQATRVEELLLDDNDQLEGCVPYSLTQLKFLRKLSIDQCPHLRAIPTTGGRLA